MKNQNEINAIEVSFDGIDQRELKQRTLAVALAALAVIPKQAINSVIKMAAPHIESLLANHSNPTGTDVKSVVALWNDKQRIAIMLAAFSRFGFSGADLVKRVFTFADITNAQRSGNSYLSLKSQHKLVAFCSWIVACDPRADWAKCKYAVAQMITAEVLNLDMIQNEDVYSVYQSHTTRLESLTASLDADLKARLMDAQLYKSAATASTQRTTSANLFQIFNAGTNAGNERVIYFDRQSDLYLHLRVTLLGAAGF